MFFKKKMLIAIAIILLGTSVFSQNIVELPLDREVIIGQLENQLTYCIKKNQEPKDMAYLLLVEKVGSIQEEENERGLAHFLEHCAFNGTENFPGNGVKDYLNSVGSGFMGGTNAFTSFDQTVYMLDTKTTDPEQFEKFFMILSEFASKLTLDHDAIDKERGIVLEERRMHSGAQVRMQEKMYETLFYGSQYGLRLPIGLPEVIANFSYKTLEDFYKRWYRPDLQAVIAVGDFDVQVVEHYIEKYFANIPPTTNPIPLKTFDVPPHSETKFTLVTDKEATDTDIALFYKHHSKQMITKDDYFEETVVNLLNTMINKRLDDIARSVDPPFTKSYIGMGNPAKPLRVYTLQATVDEGNILTGYRTLITEIERIKQHGFFQSELATAKNTLITGYEKQLSEKDKTHSFRFAFPLMRCFLNGHRMMSIEDEFALVNQNLEVITLEMIENIIDTYITDENRVIVCMAPESITDGIPTEEEILALFDEIKNKEIEPIAETVITEPLLAKIPKKISVKKPTYNKDIDLYTWTLKNGAKVYLKPTDFKNNEIQMSVLRNGGLSQADDNIYGSARFATDILNQSGFGPFNKSMLRSYLAGKDLDIQFDTVRYQDTITGRSSIKDIETMLQMVYLNFTAPRYDELAFTVWKNSKLTELRNQMNNPQNSFYMTMYKTLYDSHPRVTLDTAEMVSIVNYQIAFDFFKSRYNSANDFNFLFVGNISPTELQPYIETYIATIPNIKTKTNIVDRNISVIQRVENESIYKGQAQMTMATVNFSNSVSIDWVEEQKMKIVRLLLNEMLFDNVREKISGVYVIQTQNVPDRPVNEVLNVILFICDPNRVEEIATEVRNQVNIILTDAFDGKYLNTAFETVKKEIPIRHTQNDYWISALQDHINYNYQVPSTEDHTQFVDNLTRTDIVNTAKLCFNFDKVYTLVLYPEDFEETETTEE